MKRLLRVSLDTLAASLMSILIFVMLSIFFDKSLINIFSLTFPIQYLSCIISSIFSTGANISKQKGNSNDVMSGIAVGIIISIIIFSVLLFNVDNYLNFMNYDTDKFFVCYSIIQILFQTLLRFIINKLYYEKNNNLANKFSLTFYLINFICVLFTAASFKNKFLTIIFTLCCLFIYLIFIYIKSFQKFKLNSNVLKWIKYDSVELSNYILLLISYLFGISNTISYGENYALALTITSLITDTQWDISDSISIISKIDISKNEFNYKRHLKNSIKLSSILILSVLVMFFITFGIYKFDINIALIFIIFHILDFIICPLYKIDIYYLQLEYSTIKAVAINSSSKILRLILSFLKSPYCTVIAQFAASFYLLVISHIILKKNFSINKSGEITIKKEEPIV